jgi:hypothetical protein
MIHRRTVMLGLGAAGMATPALADLGWLGLFNGRDLTGWTRVGDANWRVEDGALSADAGPMSFLVSEATAADFHLRAEVWVSPDANSGVFIRCGDRRAISPATGYEINLFDARPDPSYGTGAIVEVARVSPMPKAGGRWNLLEVSAVGDTLSVTLNGQRTVDAAHDSKHAKGAIALQYGSGVVKFRKVEILVA